MNEELKNLSSLEQRVLNVVWSLKFCTADQVRRELESVKDLKDSTVRTVLRRLEEKGYLRHEVENRTFVYRSAIKRENAAMNQVRRVVKEFCDGSAEKLLVGMVADEMITAEELKSLAEQIARAGADKRKKQK